MKKNIIQGWQFNVYYWDQYANLLAYFSENSTVILTNSNGQLEKSKMNAEMKFSIILSSSLFMLK